MNDHAMITKHVILYEREKDNSHHKKLTHNIIFIVVWHTDLHPLSKLTTELLNFI